MKTLKTLFIALLFVAAPAFAQTTTTQTTLSAAITATSGNTVTFAVASTTGFNASVQAQEYDAYVDGEFLKIQSVNTTANTFTATRGYRGTPQIAHASGAVVYTGPSGQNGPFIVEDPIAGSTCTSTSEAYLPKIAWQATGSGRNGAATGRIWNCIGSQWMRDDGYIVLGPGVCSSLVSGNSTGTNGPTEVGTVLVAVIQAQTSVTGTNTHNYSCDLSEAASRLGLRGIMVRDVVFAYGVQTTGLGTQAATLASGTQNSVIVFTKVALPTPGASETASSNAARADSGTLTITPVVGSYNVATTTAGQFYTAKYTPATPFAMTTDLTQYFFNVALLNTATSATITNSPGAILHYAYVPD